MEYSNMEYELRVVEEVDLVISCKDLDVVVPV